MAEHLEKVDKAVGEIAPQGEMAEVLREAPVVFEKLDEEPGTLADEVGEQLDRGVPQVVERATRGEEAESVHDEVEGEAVVAAPDDGDQMIEPGMDLDIVDGKQEASGLSPRANAHGGSNQGQAPAPDEDSPRVEKNQDAVRQPSMSKPEERFGKLASIWTLNEIEKVSDMDNDIEVMVNMLGGDVGTYHRKRQGVVNRMVAELYSPPRVTQAAKLLPDLDIIPGFALDLTNGWDFSDAGMRATAWAMVRNEKPALIVGSPMCGPWSA